MSNIYQPTFVDNIRDAGEDFEKIKDFIYKCRSNEDQNKSALEIAEITQTWISRAYYAEMKDEEIDRLKWTIEEVKSELEEESRRCMDLEEELEDLKDRFYSY